MNPKTALFVAAAAVLTLSQAQQKAPWADPGVNSINRLPARAIAVPCALNSPRRFRSMATTGLKKRSEKNNGK